MSRTRRAELDELNRDLAQLHDEFEVLHHQDANGEVDARRPQRLA
jgi:hypothetical protein